MSAAATPNYRVLLSYDADRKVFTARTPELDHCSAEGATRAEAIAHLEEEIRAQVQNMLAGGSNPPAPVDEEVFTGAIALTVSKQLHRDLTWQARSEGVEVAQLAAEMLAAAIAGRTGGSRPQRRPDGNAQPGHTHEANGNSHGGGPGGARRQGGFGGGRYNTALLDDRANFIEYVRGLENPGHGGGGPRPSHGGGGGGGGPGGAGRRHNRNRGGGGGGGRPQMHGGGTSPNGGSNGGTNGGGAPPSSSGPGNK